MLGGAWARPGPLASAALRAVQTIGAKPLEQCERAQRLAKLISEIFNPESIVQETNMVFIKVDDSAAFYKRCEDNGLLIFRGLLTFSWVG